MRKILLVPIFLAFGLLAFGQESEVDSLLNVAKNANDSLKIEIYLDLAVSYRSLNTGTALSYANQALDLAKKNDFFQKQAASYNLMGAIYNVLGDYNKATVNLFEAIKIYELLGYAKGMANTSNSLGILYFNQQDYLNAIKYYEMAENLVDSADAPSSLATYRLNIGEAYQALGNNKKADQKLEDAYEIFQELNDLDGLAYALGINAKGLYAQNQYEKAIELTNQALELFIENQDYLGAIEYLNLLIDLYLEVGSLAEAEENAFTALDLSKQVNSLRWLMNTYDKIAKIYSSQNYYQLAYQYKDSASMKRNQLMDEEKQKQIANLRIIFESDRKERENEILKIDKELQSKIIAQQRIINIAVGSSLIIFIIFGVVTFRAKNQKQKANDLLKLQNEEISQQREEIETQAERLKSINHEVIHKNQLIEEKNKNITDSINYAQRIQQALLPFRQRISQVLPDHFIFYKPKDIVSGDFYWFKETEQYAIIAVADCTGHGIPGAFMSFIGHDMLNYVINVKRVYSPDEILRQLKFNVIHLLRQEQNDNRDGMDISVCVWNKKDNTVEFSGANHSLIYLQNNQLYHIKGDKITIGLDDQKKQKDFKKHLIHISNDTTFYLFTDGFIDQFGGDHDKKFMIRNFRKLLSEIHLRKMETQGIIVQDTIEDWMKNQEQIDDMLVVGFRIFE